MSHWTARRKEDAIGLGAAILALGLAEVRVSAAPPMPVPERGGFELLGPVQGPNCHWYAAFLKLPEYGDLMWMTADKYARNQRYVESWSGPPAHLVTIADRVEDEFLVAVFGGYGEMWAGGHQWPPGEPEPAAGVPTEVSLRFRFRMGGGSAADGLGIALLNTAYHGDAGAFWPTEAEEPGFRGSLAIGLDTFDNGWPRDPSDNHISLHRDGE